MTTLPELRPAEAERAVQVGPASLLVSTREDGSRIARLALADGARVDPRWCQDSLPDGVACLEEVDGGLAYRLGKAQPLSEVDTSTWDDDAALDLLLALGRVLDTAAALPDAPVHGALGPDTILLHPHGAVSVLGYGLVAGADPSIDVLAIGLLFRDRGLGSAKGLRALIDRCCSDDASKRPEGGAALIEQARLLRDSATAEPPRRGVFATLGRMFAREWAAPYERLVLAPRRKALRRAVAERAAVAAEAAESARRAADEATALVPDAPEGKVSPEAETLRSSGLERLEAGVAEVASIEAAAAEVKGCTDATDAQERAAAVRSRAAAVEQELAATTHQLIEAGQLAGDPSWMVERAEVECGHAAEIVGQLADRAQAAADQAMQRAEEVEADSEVLSMLEDLDGLLEAYGQDRDLTAEAAELASSLDSVEEAEQSIAAVQQAVERSRERQEALDQLLASLSEHVDELESTSQALDDARQTLSLAQDTAEQRRVRVSEGGATLAAAVSEHGASSEAIDKAQQELTDALEQVEAEQQGLLALADELPQVADPTTARKLARAAQRHREVAEEVTEGVDATLATGLEAVQRYVDDERDRVRQAVAKARDAVRSAIERAHKAASRVQEVAAAASAEAQALAERTPQQELLAALEMHGWDDAAIDGLVALQADVDATDEEEPAASVAAAAAEALADIEARASTVRDAVQSALDEARARADEAAARERARQELAAFGPTVEEALERLRPAAAGIEAPLRDVPDSKERVVEALERAQSAEAAAGGVQDILARDAETAPIDEVLEWVTTGRDQVSTVVEAAEFLVRALAQALVDQQRCLADAEARALVAARRAAEDHVSAARAEATKAAAWLDAGEREVRDAGLAEHAPPGLQILADEVRLVQEHADDAEELGPAAASGPTAEDVLVYGVRIEEAARSAAEAGAAARRALHRLRASLTEQDVLREALDDIAAEVRGHAVAASQLADRADAVLAGLEVWTRPVHPSAMDGAVGETHAACVAVTEAAEQVLAAITEVRTADTVPVARTAADTAGRALQSAMTAAGRMVAAEREAREVLRRVLGRDKPLPSAHLPRNVTRGGLRVGHALRAHLRDD